MHFGPCTAFAQHSRIEKKNDDDIVQSEIKWYVLAFLGNSVAWNSMLRLRGRMYQRYFGADEVQPVAYASGVTNRRLLSI